MRISDEPTALDAAGQREVPLTKPLTSLTNKLQVSSTDDAQRSPRIKRNDHIKTMERSGDPTTLRWLKKKLIKP